MPDYTLMIGDGAPYGFASVDDAEAARHAARYIADRHAAETTAAPGLPVTLAGPNGILTRPGEGIGAFRARLDPAPAAVDDVQSGDPTSPDCNAG